MALSLQILYLLWQTDYGQMILTGIHAMIRKYIHIIIRAYVQRKPT